jgi:cytidylate kinase
MAVITISREMGTGAYHIAEELARKLKYTLVDGERISACAPKYGLAPDMLHNRRGPQACRRPEHR